MVDFAKLNDPVFRAEQAKIREQREAEQAAQDKKRNDAIELCRTNEGKLSQRELEFLRSVENSIFVYSRSPSEKQLKWLMDIAARFDGSIAPKAFVTVTKGMRGFFAVLMSTDEDGFASPQNSGIGSYRTAEAAIPEAKSWAEAEGIPFMPA